jgi:FkbM family methyltransferase
MINKSRIYSFVKSLTPPVFFNGFTKSWAYASIQKRFRNVGSVKPDWHMVRAGTLKGKKLFFSNSEEWQREMLEGAYDKFFFDYLAKLDLQGKTILDIGSHVGFHTLCFAEMVGARGRVLAFEPNPFNADRIEMIVSGNKDLAGRIEVFRCALSAADGEEDFVFSDHVDEGRSFGGFIDTADPIGAKEVYETERAFRRMRVKTMRLDSVEAIAKGTLKPDIIKIDVEGAENLVLMGAETTLRKYRPLILLEVHSIYNMYAVMGMLHKLEYMVNLLKKETDGRCFLVATETGL